MAEHEHHHAGHDVKAGLTRKLGPLPVYAWAGIAGIGLGYLIYRHNKSSGASSTATAADPATDSGIVSGDDTGSAGGAGSPGLPTDASGDTTTGGGVGAGYPDIGTEVGDITDLIGSLEAGGLIPTPGATPPGGQAAAGDSTVAKTAHPATKVNTQAGNPREGKAYTTVKLANGLTAHKYAGGKEVVLPGTTKTKGTSHIAPVAHAPAAATHVNTVPGSPRHGETYRTIITGGEVVHRYGSGHDYHDVPVRKA